MATENEQKILAQSLADLTKPALRALIIRYGTDHSRVGLWSKRKDQLIEDLLEYADQLLKGFPAKTDLAENIATLKQGQREIQAGQDEQKKQIRDERQALQSFIESKIQVGRREKLLNNMASWASLLALLITLLGLAWPKPSELYQLKIRVLEEDGSHAVGATVKAQPWHPVAGKDHWLLSIPVEEFPADGTLTVTAQKNEAHAEEKVRLAQHRHLSVSLRLRYPNAIISGIVLSPGGEAVGGVRIMVFGHEDEVVLSAQDGSFSLPAHVASGEEVRLTAKKGNWRRIGHYVAGQHYEIRLIDRSDLKP